MSDKPLLAFWPQSSDALDYLDIGKQCAEAGVCFDTLRPVMTCLWFSIPYRLGVPPESLLVLHALLLAISVTLASRVLLVLAPAGGRFPQVSLAGTVMAVTVIHAVFLLPTFFHALTDTPAALVLLIALELLVLVHIQPMRYPDRVVALVGLLLGVVAGLRVFYLYPLLMTGLVYGIVSWRVNNRGSVNLFRKRYLCLMLVPIAFQVVATYQYRDEVAYLPTEGTQFWRNMHQYSAYIGYDTLLPEESYPWFGDRDTCMGLRPALERQNWRGLSCTLAGRAYFLLGSYARQTYIQTDRLEWDYVEFDPRLRASALSKEGWPFEITQGGVRLTLADEDTTRPYRMLQEVVLEAAGPLTVNLTARDASAAAVTRPSYLQLRIETVDGALLAQHWLALEKTLQRHHWHLSLQQPGRYVVVVAASPEKPAPAAFDAGDFTVQVGTHEEPYPMATKRIRNWSPVWLVTQGLVLGVVVLVLLRGLTSCPRVVVLALLPLLILALSLVIIPEQRFVVVFEITLWMAAVALLRHRWRKIATIVR